MNSKTKKIGGGIGLALAGFVAGILSAPRSGKRTRDKLKNAADIKTIEKELKGVYEETKQDLSQLSKDYPKLTERLREARDEALSSQAKVKEILKDVAGKASSDADLSAALKESKKALNSLKKYLSK